MLNRTRINIVFNLYKQYGSRDYIGENITQLEHATQMAILAEKNKMSKEIVIGSFLHDIGHLLVFRNEELKNMTNFGVMKHEEIGANFLKEAGFSNIICDIVRQHINSKRYLITTNSDYYNKLSDASKETFKFQKGNMSDSEIEEFKKNKYFDTHIKLRQFDDLAKNDDPKFLEKIKNMNPINYYKNLTYTLID